MSERGIKKEYIKQVIDFGKMQYFEKWYDINTGKASRSVKLYSLEIPEKGLLFVSVAANYGLVVTCYFDKPRED